MSTPAESAENALIVSRSAAWDGWHRAIMMLVGRGKRHSVERASKGSGVSASVIYGWLAGPDSQDWRRPHMEQMLSMMGYLGPEFTTEIIRLVQQGAFWLPDTDDMPPGELAADLSEGTADVVRRAADGEFCRVDRKALRPVGRRLVAIGARMAFSGEAA